MSDTPRCARMCKFCRTCGSTCLAGPPPPPPNHNNWQTELSTRPPGNWRTNNQGKP
jgi:hypothetical protein